MASKKSKPSKAMVKEAFALAKELGWVFVNPKEKHLLDLLRFTTYHGRNLVMETAIAMQRTHPWIDGPGALESNTACQHPARDSRFFSNQKELSL